MRAGIVSARFLFGSFNEGRNAMKKREKSQVERMKNAIRKDIRARKKSQKKKAEQEFLIAFFDLLAKRRRG